MNRFKDIWRSAPILSRVSFWICLIASIGILVAGFICPPLAEIHNSVLTAVGELFGFAALGAGIFAIEKGIDAKISKGDASIEFNNSDSPKEQN